MTRAETVLGLAGGTCSGKSRLARMLVSHLGADRVAVLPFDAYYRDLSSLAPAERRLVNYDHPDALDVDAYRADLESLIDGEPVGLPTYDFATHTRTDVVRVIEPRPIVVAEGILLLIFPEIRVRLDPAVFLDVDRELRLSRRIRRDRRDRGRDPDDVRRQFAETVEPMYSSFVRPSAVHADLVLDSAEPESVAALCLHCGLAAPEATTGSSR